jgi:hypothetical protein
MLVFVASGLEGMTFLHRYLPHSVEDTQKTADYTEYEISLYIANSVHYR